MKNHNWKLLGLTLALALLFACLFGGAALAEDPSLTFKVEAWEHGNDWQDVQPENGIVRGSYCYFVCVHLENAEDFEWTTTETDGGEPVWTDAKTKDDLEPRDYNEEAGGYGIVFYAGEENGSVKESETVFFRPVVNDENVQPQAIAENVQKLTMEYNVCDAKPKISTNTVTLLPLTDSFALTWNWADPTYAPPDNAEVEYHVIWKLPDGDELRFIPDGQDAAS